VSPGFSAAEILLLRSTALAAVRFFFAERGFLEIDSPLLQDAVPVESSVQPFVVALETRAGVKRRFLPTSPEGALKKLLAIVGRDCFEIGYAFRNGEEEGPAHRACFRMLEWYRMGGTIADLKTDTEALVGAVAGSLRRVVKKILLPNGAVYAKEALAALDLGRFETVTLSDALARWAGVPLRGPADLDGLVAAVRDRGLGQPADWRDALGVLVAVYVEEPLTRLGHPVLLTSYPVGLAAQAAPLDTDPFFAAQFELYAGGLEIANCYEERTDPKTMAEVFATEAERALARGMEPSPVDEAYLEALASLPSRVAGGSIGLERLLMTLLGLDDIALLRPVG
jgi:elongation factor P--(R)-beta-lysine ligase